MRANGARGSFREDANPARAGRAVQAAAVEGSRPRGSSVSATGGFRVFPELGSESVVGKYNGVPLSWRRRVGQVRGGVGRPRGQMETRKGLLAVIRAQA